MAPLTAPPPDSWTPPPDELVALFEEVARHVVLSQWELTDADTETIRTAGSRAAEEGLTAGEAVDLYLASVSRAWSLLSEDGEHLPSGGMVLDAVRAAVPLLAQGYQNAGLHLVREAEAARLEFVDDLLRGDADVAGLVQRAEPFGLDLRASHQVVLATCRSGTALGARERNLLDRAVNERYGDRSVLVTVKAGHLVVLLPSEASRLDVDEPGWWVHAALARTAPRRQWRVAVGRPHAGAYGVARSYQQAREALALSERIHPEEPLVPTRDQLIYRVLGRDRAALADLVETVLTPLATARGGVGPLLDTLDTYFTAGEVATETARRLHVSVRTVTYRLAKIAALTGYDPAVPIHRLTLQAAVIGARLLPWPEPEGAATQTGDGEG